MEQYLDFLQASVSVYGLWFLAFFLFLENIPIIGLIAPGLTILVLSGFLHEIIAANPLQLFMVAWVSIMCADTMWFTLGRLGNRRSLWFKDLIAKSPGIEQVITTQHPAALLFYQFMAYFRMFLPFSLGAYGFSTHKWLVMCVAGSLLFTTVFFGMGYIGAEIAQELGLLELFVQNINRILAIFAVIYGVLLIKKYQALKKA